jgi:hypothetical protein
MKKNIYTLALGLFALGLAAQNQPNKPKLPEEAKNKMLNISLNDHLIKDELPSEFLLQTNPTVTANGENFGLTEEVIGRTVYDLQTNNSMHHRIINYGNGKVSAIWTYGRSEPSFPERGMAYNHKENGTWINSAEMGSINRVETERSGFGNIDFLNSDREVIISHQTGQTSLATSINAGVGNQTWSFNKLPSGKLLWPKARVGGLDGKSIHVISTTEPTGGDFTGELFEGMNGALVYNRSLDEGQTWDKINVLLPGIDSSIYNGFGGDAYHIDVRGDVVAIVYGNFSHNTALLKSTDNGNTWTKTLIIDFPFDKFVDQLTDITGNGIADTISTCDGSLSVLIDNNNVCHVWFGNMRILNTTPGDGNYSYFPATSGIMYWNENFQQNQSPRLIADLVDHDGDNFLNIVLGTPGTITYQVSLTAMPTSGIDNNGNLYVVYMALRENYELNGITYRHIYAIKSTDGGNTWTEPVDITPFDEFTEYVYPSMARKVDDFVHIVYQRDFEPGIAAAAANATHPYGDNDIVYQAVPVALNVGIKTISEPVRNAAIFPNPARENITLMFDADVRQDANISIVNLLGQQVMEMRNMNIKAGENQITLNTNNITPGIYFINIMNNKGILMSSKFVKN